jgi:hypothetical protein
MRVAIMQPYFLPYIGYFQLIGAVDLFIVYDNIKYTKKGWINRNRMLLDGRDVVFSLPLRRDPDHLDVRDRWLAPDFRCEKLINQIRGAYSKAPQFEATMPVIERAIVQGEENLFDYLHRSLVVCCGQLQLDTPIRVSSTLEIDHTLKGQDKVVALSKAVGASTYVNTIGGLDLYDPEVFGRHGMTLKFIRSKPFEYRQFASPFVPWLSIIDVLMFNPLDAVRCAISSRYELV